MIILENKGLIDLDAIKTMGVNVKSSDSSIGYFGTGLKYAIAVFLREGVEFKLFIDRNEYNFYTEPKSIRGKMFELCYMSGPYDSTALGFTTDLGKNWELWQAYREIHSNCLDEGGCIYESSGASGVAGSTVFAIEDIDVQGTFLDSLDKDELFSDSSIEIYEGESDFIYYRGIRAKDLGTPSKFTYNITEYCALTEDRLLAYDFQVQRAINNAIASMDDKDIIRDIITDKDHYESQLSMEHHTTSIPGDAFISVYSESRGRVNSRIHSYVSAHTEPVVKKRLVRSFREKLDSLCEFHDLDYELDEDGVITIDCSDLMEDDDE